MQKSRFSVHALTKKSSGLSVEKIKPDAAEIV